MTFWRKPVPHPWLSLFLFSVWQLLMNELSPATLAAGALLAVPLPFRVYSPVVIQAPSLPSRSSEIAPSVFLRIASRTSLSGCAEM